MQTTYKIKIEACPCCGWKGEWVYYDGALGYESMICPKCRLDINDIKIEWFPNASGKIDCNRMKVIYEKPKRGGGMFGFLGSFLRHLGASKKPSGIGVWAEHRGADDAEMILPGLNATLLPKEMTNFSWGGAEGGTDIVFTNGAGQEVFRRSLNGKNWIDMTPEEFALPYGEVYSWKIDGLNMADNYKVRLLDNERAQEIMCELNSLGEENDIEKAAYLQMVSDTFSDEVDLYWLSYKYLKHASKNSIKDDNFQKLWDRYEQHVKDNE